MDRRGLPDWCWTMTVASLGLHLRVRGPCTVYLVLRFWVLFRHLVFCALEFITGNFASTFNAFNISSVCVCAYAVWQNAHNLMEIIPRSAYTLGPSPLFQDLAPLSFWISNKGAKILLSSAQAVLGHGTFVCTTSISSYSL